MVEYRGPVLSNFEWQHPVDDRVASPTGSEAKGYRYIVTTGTGDFTGYDNYIATAKVVNPASSSDWYFDAPREGMLVFIKDEDVFYRYITSWGEYLPSSVAPKDAKYLVGDTSDVSGLDNELLTQNTGVENIVSNGSFEAWYAGTSTSPTKWNVSGTGTISREATIVKIGAYSAKIVTTTSNPKSVNQIVYESKGINYFKGRTITFSCWVYCSTANRAAIYLYDGVATTTLVYHSGSGNWELLTCTLTVSTSATTLQANCDIRNGADTGYFDGAMVVEGGAPFAYCKSQEDISGLHITSAPSVVGVNFEKAWYSSGGTRRLYMCDGSDWKYTAIST